MTIGEKGLQILVVCTANICRSPMAEGLLAAAAPELDVSSAGFLRTGEPAAPDAVKALRERGVDISGHHSRVVKATMVEAADLVLTMERQHARELVVLAPTARPKIFTLGSFASALAESTHRQPATLVELLDELNAHRTSADLLGTGRDEVRDPIGRPLRHFRQTAEELDGLVRQVARGLESTLPAPSNGGSKG